MPPLIDAFRVLAALTSTTMLLSPIPMIWSIWKTKSTGVASIVPLVSMLLNSTNSLLYGYLTEHYFPIFSTFLLGAGLCVVYITVFYIHSPEKPKAHRVFLVYGVPIALMLVLGCLGCYDVLWTRHQAGVAFGYMSIVTNAVLYSSPFEKILMVLKHRSAVFFNIYMISAGTISNSTWVVYTLLTHQWILVGSNLFCSSVGYFQILLYILYHPSTHPFNGSLPTTVQGADLSKPESPVFIELCE